MAHLVFQQVYIEVGLWIFCSRRISRIPIGANPEGKSVRTTAIIFLCIPPTDRGVVMTKKSGPAISCWKCFRTSMKRTRRFEDTSFSSILFTTESCPWEHQLCYLSWQHLFGSRKKSHLRAIMVDTQSTYVRTRCASRRSHKLVWLYLV